MKLFTLAILLSITPTMAFSQNCRGLPFGPEHRACVENFYPGMREAKYAKCSQLAEARGFVVAVHQDPKRRFIRQCMRGKQT